MRKLCWVACAIIISICACTKIETTSIGAGLLPAVDGVNTLDTTLDITTANFRDPFADSLKVYKSNDQVIGIINNDPLFGKTTATAYFELKPTGYPFSFPAKTTLIADSAYLILSYKGTFGDTNAATSISQTWQVQELNENMRGDTSYSTNKTFATTGIVLGTKTIELSKLQETINDGFETAKNQIRIKLSAAFAQKMMKTLDSTDYSTDSAFRLKFKGFAVMPQTGSPGQALIRINLLDTNTKLALFYNYHLNDDPAAAKDTGVSYFRFSTGFTSTISASADNIVREYAGSKFALSLTNPVINDSFSFVQTSPGSYVSVQIPGLPSFPNSIIHRAELLAFEAPENIGLKPALTPPGFILLSAFDYTNNIKRNVPNDFLINSGSGAINTPTFGGYTQRKDVPGFGDVAAYTFDITRYVQGIVTRKDSSYTLRLSAPSNDSLRYTEPYPSTAAFNYYFSPVVANNSAIGQVRLGAGQLSRNNPVRMRLRIIYSKL